MERPDESRGIEVGGVRDGPDSVANTKWGVPTSLPYFLRCLVNLIENLANHTANSTAMVVATG